MDRNAQLEELDSLKSIYYDEEFQVNENANQDGKIQAVFWAFCELQDNFVVKYLDNLDSPEPSYMKIKHLPPVELQLTLPEDYPSKNPPKFVISCQWLNKSNIGLLCSKLDELWLENGCVEIIYSWCDFLKNESLSFLGCENELDITDLCSKHLSFIERIQRKEENRNMCREKNDFELQEDVKESALKENVNTLNNVPENLKSGTAENSNEPNSLVLKPDSLKDSHNKHRTTNPYYRKNKLDRNSDCKVEVNRYDKRAVLNLSLKMSPIKVLENYNTEREKIEFLRNFYTCNICFSDKLGKDCTKFQDCNHVFCINCIRSYFTVKIKDGSVQSIKCPEDKCATEALPSQVKEIVSEELFAKYDSVLLSTALDTLSDIIYCPRQICQYPVSWNPDEKMASCPNCQYVFCVTCKMVYHGVEPCQFKPGEAEKLVEQYENGSLEERAQMESKYGKKRLETIVNNSKAESWIKNNSKACPKCNVAIEKSQGCNKMVCWKCNAYFCWLCSALLDPKNPYFHYNDPRSRCADKLFYLVYNFDDDDDEDEWDWVEAELSDMDFEFDDDDADDDDDDDDDDDYYVFYNN